MSGRFKSDTTKGTFPLATVAGMMLAYRGGELVRTETHSMILWTIKLISSVRKAIAGRRYPSQLAWAVAFGLLLGVVPHGNLLALALLIVVLSLKLNHAMAGLTAVLVTLFAYKLDPITHQIGDFLLSQPRINEAAINAWALPLVPWTNLNNTIVLGSLVLGVFALLPVFLITYPVFRVFKPREEEAEEVVKNDRRRNRTTTTQSTTTQVDASHQQPPRPFTAAPITTDPVTSDQRPTDVRAVDDAASTDAYSMNRVDAAHTPEQTVTPKIETRIDVIRMTEPSAVTPSSASAPPANKDNNDEMDEALNYLLRQLRDSQQKDVA